MSQSQPSLNSTPRESATVPQEIPHHRPKIAVVGSLNIDLLASVESLPGPGQTIPASALIRRFGGKGANQAFAAARQETATSLIGCVGDDPDGQSYLTYLTDAGLDISGVTVVAGTSTGTALISVAANGENSIVSYAGANAELTADHVRKHRERITEAWALLLQWEVPLAAIWEAMAIANEAKVPVFFNPSPIREGFPWGEVRIDVLIVNEIEARMLFGARFARHGKHSWQRQLASHGVHSLVITRGAKSTLCITPDGHFEVPVLPLDPVDTVGAGDAFSGVFAARRAGGADFAEAVAAGNCAGGLATLKSGAQESVPDPAAISRVLRQLTAC